MSKEIDYQNLIANEFVKKTCPLIICIPTFNSYEVTKATIQSFYDQVGVEKDILITGPSGDIEKLRAFYPDINYVLTKDNYGSSGNQLINIFISEKYGYSFTMLNDNDAIFLDSGSLKKLFELLVENNYKVCAGNYWDSVQREESIVECSIICPFHCTLINNEVFKNTDLFNFNYFLLHDDLAFSRNISTKYTLYRINSVKMYHPLKLSFFKFDNISKYYFLRASIVGLFLESGDFKSKFMFLKFFIQNIIPIGYSLVNLDFSFFRIIYNTFSQFLRKDFSLPLIPSAKFGYKLICSFTSNDFEPAKVRIFDRLFLPQYLLLKDTHYSEIKVYSKYRNY